MSASHEMARFWGEAPAAGHLLGPHVVVVLATVAICFPFAEHNCSTEAGRRRSGLVSCDDCCTLAGLSSCFHPLPALAR